MFLTTISRRLIIVGMLALGLASGEAFADRGDHGGGGHHSGGGGGGGGHSWSGGGGGGGGGGGRSWSGGGGSSFRGMSSGHSAPSFSGGSSRSFSGGGGGDHAIRSFSGGSARSFGDTDRGGSVMRSFPGRPSFGGSSDGASARYRSFGGQSTSRSLESMRSGRDSANLGSTLRNSFGGAHESGDSGRSISRRSFNEGSGDSSQFSRMFRGNRSTSDTQSDSSDVGRRLGGGGDAPWQGSAFGRQRDDSSNSQNAVNTPSGNTGNTGDARSLWSRRQHSTGRPTDEQVRNFLDLRRGDGSTDDASRQARSVRGGRFDGSLGRGDGDSNLSGRLNHGQSELRNRISHSQNEGDRAWTRRFGNLQGRDHSGGGDEGGPRDGKSGRRLGDIDRQIGGGDHSHRDFGDRNFADRSYKSWRDNAWRGENSGGRDHRDQSGRWKDGDRFVAAHRIRDHWKGHHDFDDVPFRGGWWNDRHHGDHHDGHHWNHWDDFAHHHHRPFYWWSWCSAPRLTSWVTFGWPTPYYWDYGPGEYIYCYDNVVYVNGAWYQPAPIYYDNTLVLAQRVPDWTPEQAAQVEWLPLGVFVVARDGLADTNVLLQLAVTKDGVIGGTVFNQTTGATFPIEGSVEKETQRAVWTYVDETNARIVIESSIFNLTQPEATGLIHYGPDNIQVIELVRLDEPTLDAAAAAQP